MCSVCEKGVTCVVVCGCMWLSVVVLYKSLTGGPEAAYP